LHLFIFDFTGYADMVGLRDEYQIAAWQSYLTGQAGPFGSDWVLADLGHDFLALAEQILDLEIHGRWVFHSCSAEIGRGLFFCIRRMFSVGQPLSSGMAGT
jgi:hypothetical protein